jgi:bacterioferritin (cytochrome b1)
MAPGEAKHAQMLLDRLSALGAESTMRVAETKLVRSVPEILDAAIDLEERAVAHYRALRSRITRKEHAAVGNRGRDHRR